MYAAWGYPNAGNVYNLSIISRTLHAKVRIIIVYAIKIL